MNNKYKDAFKGVKPSQEAVDRYISIAEKKPEETNIKKVDFTQRKAFKAMVGIAASLAIVIGSLSVIGYQTKKINYVTATSGISTFESKNDLKKYINSYIEENRIEDYVDGLPRLFSNEKSDSAAVYEAYEGSMEMATTAAADESFYSKNSAPSAAGSYAETYTQEAGIDEADIIKTYGDLIFYVCTEYDEEYNARSKVDIFRVKDGKETLVSTLYPFDDKSYEISISDIYVSENRLIINADKCSAVYYVDYAVKNVYTDDVIIEDAEGPAYDEYDIAYESTTPPYDPDSAAPTEGNNETSIADQASGDPISKTDDSTGTKTETDPDDEIGKTISCVYDLSDVSKPKLLSTFEQSGGYVSSRMIGDELYIVSNYTATDTDDEIDYIPAVYENGEKEYVDASSIAFIPEHKGLDYIVTSQIDTRKCKRTVDPKAIIGDGSDVYCSANNIYIYSSDWSKEHISTSIIKLSIENKLEYVAGASLVGEVDSQYSFHESDGKLFVCLTLDNGYKEANVLKVLDKDLKEISKTDYFAQDESIKAVKYIGDYAYVITYEETDPLFVIDISDPMKPEILGNAKISGFSTMLVDIGNDMLLGIGYCTGEYDYIDMEVTDGVKAALFDVSDPLNPKVLDSREYKNIYSEAQYNPKAFVQNPEKGYYAISYSDEYDGTLIGALVFEIKDGKIVEKTNYSESTTDSFSSRLTYVGDWYYIIDEEETFRSFECR